MFNCEKDVVCMESVTVSAILWMKHACADLREVGGPSILSFCRRAQSQDKTADVSCSIFLGGAGPVWHLCHGVLCRRSGVLCLWPGFVWPLASLVCVGWFLILYEVGNA